ncbi:MAG: fatty acid desaturase [Planctomycetes bacterium]|nr:fatty acid desaturase [Planctomycetota bacterium]
MTSRVTFLRDRRDRLPVALTAVHAGVLLAQPPWWVVAVLLWWNANTIAHQFTHRRFFATRRLDDGFSLGLTLLLGFPQRLWRQWHLAHHRDVRWHWRRERGLAREVLAALAMWVAWAWLQPTWFLAAWLPGFGVGQLLCALQGRGEHRGGTTSIHAAWWNTLFLNDGYHVEHHRAPRVHFRDLPARRAVDARTSRWPPVLRWLDRPWLCLLERLLPRFAWLRRAVLAAHREALQEVLAGVPVPHRVVIIGGGLFPRSAILLRELWPDAAIVIVDADASHLRAALPWLPPGVTTQVGTFVPGDSVPADLVVVPLALHGDRERCYRRPPAPLTLIHDWLWRPRGRGQVVGWWLGKRLNLVVGEPALVCG